MKKIFLLGSGTMAIGIAQISLEKGFEVILYSRKNIDEMVKSKLKYLYIERAKYSEDIANKYLENLKTTIDLGDAKESDFVIEAVVEDLGIKRQYFIKLDRICDKNTIFATNTSCLSISEIACAIPREDKIIGLHFFNPVALMQLVEIVKGKKTCDNTVEEAKKIILLMGKEFIVARETPGFVVNKILIPMINEAITLFEEKVATLEDIDKSMKLGANFPIGPLALSDLIGNDVVLKIMQTIYEKTGNEKYKPSSMLIEYVQKDLLGRKTKNGFYKY